MFESFMRTYAHLVVTPNSGELNKELALELLKNYCKHIVKIGEALKVITCNDYTILYYVY